MNMVVVVKIQSILNMTKSVENTNINSVVIFRRKKGETLQSIADMLSLEKFTIYHVHTMRISLSIVTPKELPEAFSTLLYIQFDKLNLKHLDQCIKRYTI